MTIESDLRVRSLFIYDGRVYDLMVVHPNGTATARDVVTKEIMVVPSQGPVEFLGYAK